jgi:N-acetylmuramoyl-L-alanine amidase
VKPALALLLALAGWGGTPAGPQAVPTVILSTPRGDWRIEARELAGGEVALPARQVAAALGADLDATDPAFADFRVGGTLFRFLVGTPFVLAGDRMEAVGHGAARVGDTLFLPLPLLTHLLPGSFPARYRWEPAALRLVEAGPAPVAAASTPAPAVRLRRRHVVVVDPGHGGEDPGNPCRHCPAGITEKDIALRVGLQLRDELERRGVQVRLTRSTDTRPSLRARAETCSAQCDLFVSLHVDALAARGRRRNAALRGFSAYIIGEENTEDARRVAQMENEALRYDSLDTGAGNSALDFILRDLQMNEYLRESARAATLLHGEVGPIHPGDNRGVRKFTNIAVLNLARRPAMLVEMGFGDHPGDAKFLADPKSQRQLAVAMARSIETYLIEYEVRSGVASVEGTP